MLERVRDFDAAVRENVEAIGAHRKLEAFTVEHLSDVEFETSRDDRHRHTIAAQKLEEPTSAGSQRDTRPDEGSHLGEPVGGEKGGLAPPRVPERDSTLVQSAVDLVRHGLPVLGELFHEQDGDIRFDQRPVEIYDDLEGGTSVVRTTGLRGGAREREAGVALRAPRPGPGLAATTTGMSACRGLKRLGEPGESGHGSLG